MMRHLRYLAFELARAIAIAAVLVCSIPLPAAWATQATLVTPGSPLPMSSLATFLNDALLSVGSCNSGNSAPANGTGAAAFAGECWINTTANPWVFSYTPDGTHWAEFGTLNTSTFAWTPYSNGVALVTGTSGATIPLLNGNLTFSGSNAYGTPASITLTNAGGLPIATGLSGAGSGVLAAMANAVNGTGGLLTYGIIGTSGATVPLNNGSNTFSGANSFTAAQTFTNSDLKLLGSSTGATTFTSANAGATNYTATVPANTGQLAELNLAQTFSAAQSFNSGDLLLNGSGSGAITLNAPSAAGSNTATLPANTGIIAELNLAQTFSAAQTFNASDLICCGGSATAGVGTVSSAGVIGSEQFVTAAQGGLGASFAAATGVLQFSAGTASASTALANGTTATTQAAGDTSTDVATDAFVNTIFAAPPAIGGTTAAAAHVTTLNASGNVVFGGLQAPGTVAGSWCSGSGGQVYYVVGANCFASGSAGAGGSNTQVQYNSSGVLAANSGFVYTGGNVGIGTTTPSSVDPNSAVFLTVNNGTVNGVSEISIGSNATGVANVGRLNFYNSSLGTSDKRIAIIDVWDNGATNSGEMDFYTYNAGTANSAMSILPTGAVTIGAASPAASALLTVNGGANIGGSSAGMQYYICTGTDTSALNTLTGSGIHSLVLLGACGVTTLTALPANFTLAGMNRLNDVITTSSATGNVVTLASGDKVENLGFNSSVTRTSGDFILASGVVNITLRSLYMQSFYNGIELNGVGSPDGICPISFSPCSGVHGSDIVLYGNTTPHDGILIDGASGASQPYNTDVVFDEVFAAGATTGSALLGNGVEVTEAGDVTFNHLQVIFASNGITLNPNGAASTGHTIQFFGCESCLLDSGTNGLVVSASNGAVIDTVKYTDGWIASNTGKGVLIETDAGNSSSINDTDISGNVIGGNAYGIAYADNSSLDATNAARNVIAGNSTTGIYLGAGITVFRIIDNKIGFGSGWGLNGLSIQCSGSATPADSIVALNDAGGQGSSCAWTFTVKANNVNL